MEISTPVGTAAGAVATDPSSGTRAGAAVAELRFHAGAVFTETPRTGAVATEWPPVATEWPLRRRGLAWPLAGAVATDWSLRERSADARAGRGERGLAGCAVRSAFLGGAARAGFFFTGTEEGKTGSGAFGDRAPGAAATARARGDCFDGFGEAFAARNAFGGAVAALNVFGGAAMALSSMDFRSGTPFREPRGTAAFLAKALSGSSPRLKALTFAARFAASSRCSSAFIASDARRICLSNAVAFSAATTFRRIDPMRRLTAGIDT